MIPSSIEDWGKDLSPVLDGLAPGRPRTRPQTHRPAALPHQHLSATPADSHQHSPCTPANTEHARLALARMGDTLATRRTPGPQLRLSQRLAVCLAITATVQPLDGAATALGGSATALLTSLALRRWSRTPHWPAMQEALIALADHLDNTQAPLDYARRRQLTYAPLLPKRQWQDICRATGLKDPQGTLLATARLHLRERISGTPMLSSSNPAHLHYARHRSPRLAAQLEHAAQTFLASHGITDEPVTWQPPLELVSGLTLPGPEITHRLRHHLHHAPGEPYYDLIGHTAAALGCPAQAMLALLAGHPDLHQDPPTRTTPAQNPTDLLRPALTDPHAPPAAPTVRSRDRLPDPRPRQPRAELQPGHPDLDHPGTRAPLQHAAPSPRRPRPASELHPLRTSRRSHRCLDQPARDDTAHERERARPATAKNTKLTPTDPLKQHLGRAWPREAAGELLAAVSERLGRNSVGPHCLDERVRHRPPGRHHQHLGDHDDEEADCPRR